VSGVVTAMFHQPAAKAGLTIAKQIITR